MRYTVLTYIFGGYELPHEILEKDPDADYVLVTDDPTLRSDTWRIIVDDAPGRSVFGRCYEVRFHPWRYADTDIVIRIDGSIQPLRSLRPLVDEMERGGYDRCLMIHPRRCTMEAEYDTWVRYRRYSAQQARRCIAVMRCMGYDMGYRGLYQGCMEIQRRSELNQDVNDIVFGVLSALGRDGRIERLDQTVTSFILNRFFAGRLKVLPVAESLVTDGRLMQWYVHHSEKPVPQVTDPSVPYLFNMPVCCWQP